MKRLAFALGTAALAFWACVEEPTSPARCPDFCPGNKLVAVETLLTDAITGDSTFQGYALPAHVGYLPLTAENGIDSRSITQMAVFGTRTRLDSIDTTTGPNVIDSMKLMVRFLRPDTASRNLRLSFYVLPDSIDSTTTLADLAASFAAAPLRVVNVDSLLAQPSRRDSIMGDTVVTNGTTDTNTVVTSGTAHIVTLRLKIDSANAPYHAADSGRLSLGVVVTADNRPTVFLTSGDIGLGLSASWFYRVDSAGTLLRPDSIFYNCKDASKPCTNKSQPPDSLVSNPNFDSFLYTAPTLPPDSNLLIGGSPSQRALLRIKIPKGIRDSSQVLRAELFLIPTATAPVSLGDSVLIIVNRVFADFGLKSPLDADTAIQGISKVFGGNPTDTVRIQLTPLFRAFVTDTTLPTSVFVRLLSLRRLLPDTVGLRADTTGRTSSLEGSTFTTLRFYSSRTQAFRPVIKLTYVPRIKLGAP